MNGSSWIGSLVPVWIIGAPLLLALIELMKTPTPRTSSGEGHRTGTGSYSPRPT